MAKRWHHVAFFYAALKIVHLIFQDRASCVLGRRARADCFFIDGNALLSAAGRAGNYLYPARDDAEDQRRAPPGHRPADMIGYVLGRRPRPACALKGTRALGIVQRVFALFGFRPLVLPDEVVFIDLSPAAAFARLRARGVLDTHENLDDLEQARRGYLAALDAARRLGCRVRRVVVAREASVREVCDQLLDHLAPSSGARADDRVAFHVTDERLDDKVNFLRRALHPRYVFRYFLLNLNRGAWRELLFPFSRGGRVLLQEGYSAGCMREIYEGDEKGGVTERAFLGYPSHRAVSDRLQILRRRLTDELETRAADGPITVFTAPSGFADDVLGAIRELNQRRPTLRGLVRLVAVDLDPSGEIEARLRKDAALLEVPLTFIRGDITDDGVRAQIRHAGPFDVALFVGLSSWLPKPHALSHLRLLRECLGDGLLVSDCFAPDAYALSGRYVGFRASYYTPARFEALLGRAGFDVPERAVPGRNGINHVVVARAA